jgi:single-strand DNA-binding protein
MTNVVVITGRLCADPESRQTQSGTAVCHFRLAVGRNRKVEGKPEADFISCVCWGKTAEFAVKYLHRGGMITAEGRLQNADYTDNNGVKHYAMEVNVDQLNFCGDGKPSGNAQQAAQGDAGNYPQNYPPQQPNGYNAPQGGYYDGYYEQALPPPQNYGRR